MSAEKYMERAREIVFDIDADWSFDGNVHASEQKEAKERIAKAIAALCAQIEQETRAECSTAIESLLNPEINASWDYALRRAQAAIRAGKP